MRTLRFLLRKEYLQIFRDRIMVAQLLLLPAIQLALLANAATFEIKSARLVVVDEDRSATSRGLVDRMRAGGRFELVKSTTSAERADDAMMRRQAGVILRIPREFERDLVRTHTAPVQLILNAEDGAAAGVTLSYAQRIVAEYASELAATLRLSTLGGEGPVAGQGRLDVRARGWYNPNLDYRFYMVPGILVQLVTMVGTLLTALNIVREKELGTLEQLNVTPVTRGQFIAAKLIPLWSLGLVALTIGMLVARFAFHVPMRGSVLLVFGTASVYLLAALGVGLLVSTMVSTQQQAMFVTFFIVLVYLLMSGLFTPVRSMPIWAQWIAQANPVMHFIEIMRAVMLRGAGLREIARSLAILSAIAVGVFSLSVRQYAKRAA
ncbi:MAG: ABC transporter permease [Gemmatimonadetes bacterium]|nr:MAG: ABC transporter permease [Gemmatimonadota bacterium]